METKEVRVETGQIIFCSLLVGRKNPWTESGSDCVSKEDEGRKDVIIRFSI